MHDISQYYTIRVKLNLLLLLLRLTLHRHPIIPCHKELCKQIKVTSIHEKRRDIILLSDMTSLSLNRMTVIIKCHNGHTHPNEHLTQLHKGDYHGIEPFGS